VRLAVRQGLHRVEIVRHDAYGQNGPQRLFGAVVGCVTGRAAERRARERAEEPVPEPPPATCAVTDRIAGGNATSSNCPVSLPVQPSVGFIGGVEKLLPLARQATAQTNTTRQSNRRSPLPP
jgi:hypothetical protein